MSTNANGYHESGNNSGNRTYTSLIDANGKTRCRTLRLRSSRTGSTSYRHTNTFSGTFGSAFWHNENTNPAGSGSNEDAWSTAINTSTAEESGKSRDDNRLGNNGQTKKAKRKAWFVVCRIFVRVQIGIRMCLKYRNKVATSKHQERTTSVTLQIFVPSCPSSLR
jgi:hypothetical protein